MITEVSRAEQIRLEWKRGHSPTELAREYSISRQAVHQDIFGLQREGKVAVLRSMFPDSRWGWEEIQRFLSLAQDGRNGRQIARELGCSLNASCNKLRLVKDIGMVEPAISIGIGKALGDPDYLFLGNVLRALLGKRPRTLDLIYNELKIRNFQVYRFRRGLRAGKEWFNNFIHSSEVVELHELITEQPEIIQSRTWSGVRNNLTRKI